MKTLTEFSTLTLRKAAAARAAAGGSTVGAPAAELDDAMDASDSAAANVPEDAAAEAVGGEPAEGVGGGLPGGRGGGAPAAGTAAPGRGGRGGARGGRGGDGGGRGGDRGGPGGDRRDKPRGLGSLKMSAQKDEPKEDDRPGRGEMPRAGIGWQLTAAPRDFGDGRG